MKILDCAKRVLFTACASFTLLVYILYLFRSLIPSQENSVLPLSFLNGFLLFGLILGLTNLIKDRLKLPSVLKRLIHFAVTAVNFFVSITLVTGYLTGDSQYSPLTVANRILYCFIAYLLIYFICVGIAALTKKLLSLGKKEEAYQSVLSK